MNPLSDALFDRLFDDAALFPPGNAPMPEALRAHAAYRAGDIARYVGPFVCPADRLGELAAEGPEPPAVSVVSSTAEVAPYPGVRIVAVEVRPGAEPVELPAGVTGYLEFPRDADVEEWAQKLADSGWRAKFRTGGLSVDAFPSDEEFAEWIAAAVRAGVPFKCTAGLHHAVCYHDPATGFDHHGFVNVLVATDLARSGAAIAEIAEALRNPAVVERVPDVDPAVRESFVSFGTCSIAGPLDDLRALGLLQ